jgi:uncharacterized membrane protein
MSNDLQRPDNHKPASAHPFRGALWRGLAVLCPPLLTVLIIVWAINTTKVYFLAPVTTWAREGIVWVISDVQQSPADKANYHRLPNGAYIPVTVYDAVRKQTDSDLLVTGDDFYRQYVDQTYLQPYYAIPFFLSVFILLLYFLGKFMAFGIGVFFGNLFDRTMRHLPGVRAVYSSVKQVSDFVFNERALNVTRIVAVEFPRKGIWSLGFVTGESLLALADVAQEPVAAVLIPYSPMPVTGSLITVRKSECIDLDITFDQACQFIVSCGVVLPPAQLEQMKKERAADDRLLP